MQSRVMTTPSVSERRPRVALVCSFAVGTVFLVLMAVRWPVMVLILPIVAVLAYQLIWRREIILGTAGGYSLIALFVASSTAAPSSLRTGAVLGVIAIMLSALAVSEAPWPHLDAQTLAFLGFLALTLAVSAVANPAGAASAAYVLAVPSLAFLVARRSSFHDRLVFWRTFVLFSVLQAVYATGEVAGALPPLWGYRNVGLNGDPILRYNPFLPGELLRAQGTTGHPIILSLIAGVCLILGLSRGDLLGRPWAGLAVAGGIAGMILSGTRSAAFALIVVLMWRLIISRVAKRRSRNFLLFLGLMLAAWYVYGDLVSDAVNSDSFGHRLAGLSTAPTLLSQPLVELVLGGGLGREQYLFSRGLLQTDGFNVVDNQFIYTQITSGLLGLLLLATAILLALRRSHPASRMMLGFLVVMFLSFDVTTWHATSWLLATLLGLADMSLRPQQGSIEPENAKADDDLAMRAPQDRIELT